MNIAEELKSKFLQYSTAEGRKKILELLEDWWVKKQVVVTDGEEMPPTYAFEDGSTLRLEDLSTGRSKQFVGDIPVLIRPHYRAKALRAIAELEQDNPEFAKGLRALFDREAA